MSIIKLVFEDRPLPFLGIPGIVSMTVGAFLEFGCWTFMLSTHKIATNVALASISFILIGFFMLSTAITLYAITKLAKR